MNATFANPSWLTVLYDARCEMCTRARRWLELEPTFVPLRFIAAGSPGARAAYPALDPRDTLREITVVDDRGHVYRGAKAWVMCLWATRRFRERALGLTSPELWPIAKRIAHWVSERRHRFGRLGAWLIDLID